MRAPFSVDKCQPKRRRHGSRGTHLDDLARAVLNLLRAQASAHDFRLLCLSSMLTVPSTILPSLVIPTEPEV